MSNYWIGVDLGGTKILTGLFDDSMKLVARVKHPTKPESGAAAVLQNVAHGVDNVLQEAKVSPEHVHGLGFGIPGQIVPNSTMVRYAPNLDWKDFDLRPFLPANWTWPVVLENDVRMGTYGEFSHGSARGSNSVFGIFIGTGCGGGL